MKFAARQTKYDYQYSQWYCRTWYEYAKLHAKKFTKLKPYNKEKLDTLSKKFYGDESFKTIDFKFTNNQIEDLKSDINIK